MAMTMKTIFVSVLCVCVAVLCALVHAESNETLTLRPLQDGRKVRAHFRFSTRERAVAEAAEARDTSAFPKVLKQILTKYDAESLHLTFALGKHSDARYGTALGVGSDALAHAPFGARLQVQLQDTDSDDNAHIADSIAVQERWRGITAELGGIFSASLNQMDLTVVTDMSDVDPSALGAFPADATSRSRGPFLHAALAREEICTENLAPWLKMLPCRSHAGLGKLIDPIKYVSGEYLSLSLFASRSAYDGAWVLEQQLVTVQKLRAADKERWSLQSVFFHSLPSDDMVLDACPLATQSAVFTETPSEGYELQYAPDAVDNDVHARRVHDSFRAPVTYTTSLIAREIPLGDPWLARVAAAHETPPSPQRDLVTVHRFMTGYGQVHGGIAVRLENNHPQCAMRVTYHDVVPWYLRMFFSTFQARAARTKASPSPAVADERLDAASLVTDTRFVPAEVRGRPNEMHVELVLPANASIVFSVQLEKAFLRLSEHPPDANRGFDVASGVATFEPVALGPDDSACHELKHDTRAFTRTLFTEPLLVPLPTPDFSMPYNVITMTSTVVAFFVGSMLNTLLRKAPRIKQMMAPQ